MEVFDIHHGSKALLAFPTTFLNWSGDVDGEIIDTAGYEAAEFIFSAVEITTQDIPIVLYEGDDPDMVGATQVSDDDILGDAVLVKIAAGPGLLNSITHFGYIGKKRYVRPNAQSGFATATRFKATCLLANSLHQPTLD